MKDLNFENKFIHLKSSFDITEHKLHLHHVYLISDNKSEIMKSQSFQF